MGLLYGLVESRLGWSPLVSGAAFGALVDATAPTLVPALQLTPTPTR